MGAAGSFVVGPRIDQGDVFVVDFLDRIRVMLDDLVIATLVAVIEDSVIIRVGIDVIIADRAAAARRGRDRSLVVDGTLDLRPLRIGILVIVPPRPAEPPWVSMCSPS